MMQVPPGMHLPGMMPGTDLGVYQPPISHHQERAALQQQLQELYCMPPGPQHQEKIARLQEKLNILAQHEATEQCSGGATCILQSPLFTSPMIDSPQVSSTTGRGRGKGGPRKPRMKKAEKLALQQQQIEAAKAAAAAALQTPLPDHNSIMSLHTQLPVSEDCVTPGAGLSICSGDLGDISDIAMETSSNDIDQSKQMKKRGPRGPRKPRELKTPPSEKIPKERKKREPKDPERPKRKYVRKKKLHSSGGEEFDDSVGNITENGEEVNSSVDESKDEVKIQSTTALATDSNDIEENLSSFVIEASSAVEPESTGEAKSSDENKDKDDDDKKDKSDDEQVQNNEVTDTGEKKSDEYNFDQDSTTVDSDRGSTPRRGRRSRGGSSRINKGYGRRGRPAGTSNRKPRPRKGTYQLESEGEGEDMPTPPPSPPDGDADSSIHKRRSTRNTQRKKYIDDVMLRFSDDDSPTSTSGKQEIDSIIINDVMAPDPKEEKSAEPVVKHNFVYINTTDDDIMIVQHILTSRMGKREVKPKPPTPPPVLAEPEKDEVKKEDEDENDKKTEDDGEKVDSENEDEKVKSDNEDEKVKSDNEDEKVKSDNEDEEASETKIKVKKVSKKKSKRKVEKDEEIDEEINDEEKVVEPKDTDDETSEKEDDDKVDEKVEKKVEKMDDKDDEEIKVDDEKIKVDDDKTDDEDEKTKDDDDDEKSKEDDDDKSKDDDVKSKDGDEKAKDDDEKSKDDVQKVKVDDGEKKSDELVERPEDAEPIIIDVEEFYVKYRNFSYLHCDWKTEDELYRGDKRIASKIKRFKMKQAQQLNIFENLDEEPFNPDYMEVDRILDVAVHTDPTTKEKVKHYLVKWRALQYEDSTWELEQDVDLLKVEQFEKFSKIPPRDQWRPKKKPHPSQWTKLDKSPTWKGGNTLREYQLEGLNWLLFSWYNNRNCILADEMGLGKTIQSLTFVNAVYEYGIRGPFLVIAPLSTIPNWQREIESWTDMNVIVYHGSSASRNMLQEYEMYFKTEKGHQIKEITKFNVLITTFEIIVTDFADLKGFNWRLCVIDEAHRLKNRNCKLLEGLRQLTLEHRVLLSGTPLQNNVNELFSLLNFLEPTQFSNCEAFLQEFGSLKTETEVNKLQALLKPMMLRRLKEDVEKSLAPKEETVVEVELTNIQKKYYRGILERNFSFLSKGTSSANIPNLMNTMMELRKCCIHPYLLNGAEDQIQYDYKNAHGEDPDVYYKALIQSSGKMVLMDKLLPKLKANGHRVLIFSQMVKCLDILEDYLMYRKYTFERIDGRIRGNLRQAAIDRYSKPDSDRFCFLLCTKAGGLGINLTAADTVIIYDSDWNPQNDLQAQARCHRIGQQKMVKIYRLLCRNTYEREMFDKASLKLGLDKAILQSMNTTQGGKETNTKQLSKKEIEDLLKKGAYGAIMDEDDGDKFCEEDIDMILARRTQVITMESEKGSTFSKASFASSANRTDINLDDPDFWNKWAKKAEIDTTEKDETEDLVISEPRRRTQIKRYGHDESVMDMSELESAESDSDIDNDGLLQGGLSGRAKRRRKKKSRYLADEYVPREKDIVYGSWARSECFKIEKGLLTFGYVIKNNKF